MKEKKAPWYFLALLILAGESVFILPFVLSRVFRPTVLETFSLDNVDLGFCFSIYGLVALFSYLFGGPVADKYHPRKLIAVALWMTSLGGLFYATFPNYTMLKILYGFWGFTTIFLFWAPMIKATRLWGGATSQGKAFGFLDGGRGMVGALFGVLGVLIFSMFSISASDTLALKEAFKYVILASSGIVATVGILVWFFLKTGEDVGSKISVEKISLHQIKEVLRLPAIWMLMIIILCAYVGYKITDVFTLYANDVLLYDKTESAKVGTFLLFIRPIVGVIIGITADRTKIVFWLLVSFIISLFGAILFATGIVNQSAIMLFFISTGIVATGVYAARSLYFAVLEKGKIPILYTGTAVGLISIVGYTPDIFAGPLIGYLIESSPGITGLQNVFWMLAGFSLIGGIVSWMYYYKYR